MGNLRRGLLAYEVLAGVFDHRDAELEGVDRFVVDSQLEPDVGLAVVLAATSIQFATLA